MTAALGPTMRALPGGGTMNPLTLRYSINLSADPLECISSPMEKIEIESPKTKPRGTFEFQPSSTAMFFSAGTLLLKTGRVEFARTWQ
jgi:hypothetical protein